MKPLSYIIPALVCILFYSCNPKPENVHNNDEWPNIFPDYKEVTIPANIAPLNFNVENAEAVVAELIGDDGSKISASGDYADFDIDSWHQLTYNNIGKKISVSVIAKINNSWQKFRDFNIFVSGDSLNDYGLTYRLIPPGYQTFAHIGIYQRNIHNFDEEAIVDGTSIQGQCMNCHVPNHANPDEFQLHVRGQHPATLVRHGGKDKLLQTATDSTIANCMYAYWHPSGKYIAYSLNLIHQTFFEDSAKYIEVYDNASDALILDVEKDQLILYDKLMTENFESYPVFSVDGNSLYFCSSKPYVLEGRLDKMRYSLLRVSFDSSTGKIGNDIDTIINAETSNVSITHPRPSYDGKFIMFSQASYSVFPIHHTEADLYLMNLSDSTIRPINEVNSQYAESFHNFSSNSRWFVFNSRRVNQINNLLFISHIDENGNCTKPFLLPQKNPKEFYDNFFFSYNVPDFTIRKVELDMRQFADDIFHKQRIQVGTRRN